MSDMKSQTTGFSTILEAPANVAGTKQLAEILGPKVFAFPKPPGLIDILIRQVTESDSIIMDSFAGSGTTGHAVLELNNNDGGHRRFILVEMEESVCRDVTAQRLARVIKGAEDAPGLGGGFRYCTLGEPLFDEAGNIREHVKFSELAAHVFFSETGSPIPKQASDKTPFLGAYNGKAVYLLFNGVLGDKSIKGGNVLTNEVLRHLPNHGGTKVIYGEGCRLGAARLKRCPFGKVA